MPSKQIKQKQQQQTDLWLHYKQANEQQPQLSLQSKERKREGDRGASFEGRNEKPLLLLLPQDIWLYI